MTLTLRIDEDGIPYILLESVGVNLDDQVLELFIKRACEKGVEIVDETKSTFPRDRATIRLKKQEINKKEDNLIPPITIEFSRWQVENLRMYFGENSKTQTEHWAFKIFDDALKRRIK